MKQYTITCLKILTDTSSRYRIVFKANDMASVITKIRKSACLTFYFKQDVRS